MYENKGMKLYNFLPLSTSSILRHIWIDTKLLIYLLIKSRRIEDDNEKDLYWNAVFNWVFNLDEKESKQRNDGAGRGNPNGP